ncbi:MAG: aldo/keto reductase [Bacteroidales bacterium]|jgi:aryl-alcohol dehydrogenase-like predicted oxidoreductase|nr:aldo/keto reductase [Bacteroidales bacterium]
MINRRKFIQTGAVVIGSGFLGSSFTLPSETAVDRVKLGKSGLKVSRIAMGTGTVGSNRSSNQTRLGAEKFNELVHHAYERGIRFYDMADGYGSQPFIGAAIKGFPREKITLLTKLWTHGQNAEWVKTNLDRCRKEVGTDYFDVLLMHCMMSGDWAEKQRAAMDALYKAKQDGIVKAVGVSCHNLDALSNAAENPWVDVIMARINPFQTNMDGDPATVCQILGTAIKNGKGVIGMKIFGEGKHIKDDERQASIQFALTKGNINCMTLGLESVAQMDDAITRVMKSAKRTR